MIHFDPFLSFLIHFWSILIHFDPFWSFFIHFYPIWSNSINFEPFWSILIQFDPVWSNMIQSDPIFPFLSSDPCSTRWWIQFAWHGHCACQTYHSSRNFWPGRRIFKILHWIFQPRGLYILIKLRFSEKVTKIWTHFPCNVKTNRFFFQILLWPSQNIWILLSLGGIN